ncbi:MAG: DNA translocase FtsK 4TM domain-containing protein, partial [Pyrinomonadaceae bacterium]
PMTRLFGLILLGLSSAALLALAGFHPAFDSSIQPGGLTGTILARLLVSGLNVVGSTILLVATLVCGLLLGTDFSLTRVYDRTALFIDSRFHISSRMQAWRVKRRLRAQAREEKQKAASAIASALRSQPGSQPGNENEAVQTAPPPTAASVRRDEIFPRTGAVVEKIPDDLQADLFAHDDEAFGTARLQTQNESAIENEFEDEDAEIAAILKSAEVVRAQKPADTSAASADPAFEKSLISTAPVEKKRPPKRLTYRLPHMDFMNPPTPRLEQADDELLEIATRLAEKCKEFNVTGQIKHICPGPVVTTYEFKPDPGVKYVRVTSLVDDLCLALQAESVRIDRMPGKSHVGIEVPNPRRETIAIREVIESHAFRDSSSKLTLALGKTIDGLNYVTDLAKMPHLLIAGATGAGKSVCVNALIVAILYKATPEEVKFIMVDPKRLELGLYADIPHLAAPIITEPKMAAHALKWAVAEMERRYKELAGWGVRNIDGFNTEIGRRNGVKDYGPEGQPLKPLPYIVIIIDELADLMMVSGREVEESITRLAQMARAVGIHLVLATQRPSVDVITGLIKANFPSRISFRVSSKVDSRTIIDANGAEQLLGRGDMLFLPPGTSRLIRVHGAYLDETEVNRIVAFVKQQAVPTYDETITQMDEDEDLVGNGTGGIRDELFDEALKICVEMKRGSTSVLQRRLRIGYGRAAAILDAMEREGFVDRADGARPRPVTHKAFETVAEWEEQIASNL